MRPDHPISRRHVLTLLAATLSGSAALTAASGRAASALPDLEPQAEREDLIGELRFHTTVYEDTLLEIARTNGLGIVELMAANRGVDPWLPGANRRIVLPTAHLLPDAPRQGLVINIADLRMFLFGKNGEPVATFPLGIGREGLETPMGRTTVVRKAKDPTWRPTPATRQRRPELPAVVPPGPDNPLGDRALYLGWPAYLIHGTNKPYGVGRRVSSGCIRMYPENVQWLFEQVPVGTAVTVVNQPVKFGHHNGDLFIEVNPSLEQIDQIEDSGIPDLVSEPLTVDREPIIAAAGEDDWRLNWTMIKWAIEQREGVPIQITR